MSKSKPSFVPGKTYTLPARTGIAVPLSPHQTLKVINTHGTQVVDTWAFTLSSSSTSPPDLSHHMSMSHTRARNNRFSPLTSDVLYTNHRLPILQLVEDTSPGVHDTVIAACDIWRYRELAGKEMSGGDGYYHESCSENLKKALGSRFGKTDAELFGGANGPDPLNLWMNIPIHPKHTHSFTDPSSANEVNGVNGVEKGYAIPEEVSPSAGADLSFEKPVSKTGDYVRLKNVSGGDVVVVMSACPQDLLEINCKMPREVEFVVEE